MLGPFATHLVYTWPGSRSSKVFHVACLMHMSHALRGAVILIQHLVPGFPRSDELCKGLGSSHCGLQSATSGCGFLHSWSPAERSNTPKAFLSPLKRAHTQREKTITCFVKFKGHRRTMNGKIKVGWGSLEFNLSFQECSSASLTEYSPCGSGDPSSNLSKKSTVWNVLHLVRSTLLAAAAESRGSVVQSLKSVSTGLVRLDP